MFDITPFPPIMFKSTLKNSQWADVFGQINSFQNSNVFSCVLKFCTLPQTIWLILCLSFSARGVLLLPYVKEQLGSFIEEKEQLLQQKTPKDSPNNSYQRQNSKSAARPRSSPIRSESTTAKMLTH